MTTIDLAKLPPPDVVERLDFETIYQGKLSRFRLLYPQYSAILESDPAIKLLELSAYDELLLRARINDAACAVMLAYAKRSDLDNLVALLGVERMLVSPGDPDASPPIAAVYEDDERLRYRAQMALEGLSTAGSRQAYIFHALTADISVADVAVDSPTPGVVRLSILSDQGDGTPLPALLDVVYAALSAETIRPLTDTVLVVPAEIVPFRLKATLYRMAGPAGDLAEPIARARLDAYLRERRRLGRDVPLSGLCAALHQPGIARVEIDTPATDLICGPTQAIGLPVIDLDAVVTDEQ